MRFPRARLGPTLAAFLLWGALASPARGQFNAQTAPQMIASLDRDIADLEDVARKIRGDNYRIVIGGTVGDPQAILVSPEQVESLFVTALLNGSMRPDQATGFARAFGVMTRQYLAEIEAEIRRLGQDREILARALANAGLQPPAPPAVPLSAGLQGSVNGKWSAGCSWNDPDVGRTTDGGTFSLTFDGAGGVAGIYQSAASSYAVSGAVGADGSASGNGAGAGWSVQWSGRFQQSGGGVVGSGGLAVRITEFGGGSCTGTWAVP